MKRHAPAARWVLSAGAVLGLSLGCTTNPYKPEDGAQLTPAEKSEIEARNAAQDTAIADAQAAIDDLRENLYPVSAADVALSEATVVALFGSANPARTADPVTRKRDTGYVSAEQALRLMGTPGSSGNTSGGGGTSENVTIETDQADTNNQSFESADNVQEAINALRWASNIKIETAGTSWEGTNVDNVQEALADLDDQVKFPALGAGTNPTLSPTDDFPTIAEATDVKGALNALRYYPVPVGSGFILGDALANGYMTEAITSLDNRAKRVEQFIQGLANGMSQIVNASGVLYATNNQPTFNAQVRKTDPSYSTPLEGSTLQGVIGELTLIVQNYRWTDNVLVDFTRAPLQTSRWAPGSTVRGGQFALQQGEGANSLDKLLDKINAELTDLNGRVGGGGSSSGTTGDAFSIAYDASTADASTRVFSSSTNVGDALGALRHATNVRFNVDGTLAAANFPSGSNTVQTAIASAYLLNRSAIDQLRADTSAGNTAYVTALTNSLFGNTTFQNQLTQFINNSSGGGTSGGGPTNSDAVTLAGAAAGAFGAATNVTGALTNLKGRVDAAETNITTLQGDLAGIRNVTNSTFRDNLRSFLLSDPMFLSGLVQTTTVVNAINSGGGGGGGGAKILGLSANATTGKMMFNNKTGIQAAAEYCKATSFGGTTYSTAHACTTSEVVAALPKATNALLDSLNATNNASGWWVWDNVRIIGSNRTNALAAGGTHRVATCQDFLYETGDIADATYGFIDMHQQGTSATGYSPRFVSSGGCGTARKILCCQ